jgi:hypothetical protein
MKVVYVPRQMMGARTLTTLLLSALVACPPPMPPPESVVLPTPYAPEIPPPPEAPSGRRPGKGDPAPSRTMTDADYERLYRASERRRRKAQRRILEGALA